MIHTIEQAAALNAALGQYWFTPDTLRFFDSKIDTQVYPVPSGMFFVSSEQFDEDAERLYTLRYISDEGHVDTIGEFQQYPTSAEAHTAAKVAAQAVTTIKA